MRSFAVLFVLFLARPAARLNPLGRAAFLGYYAGILAVWSALTIAAAKQGRPAGR